MDSSNMPGGLLTVVTARYDKCRQIRHESYRRWLGMRLSSNLVKLCVYTKLLNAYETFTRIWQPVTKSGQFFFRWPLPSSDTPNLPLVPKVEALEPPSPFIYSTPSWTLKHVYDSWNGTRDINNFISVKAKTNAKANDIKNITQQLSFRCFFYLLQLFILLPVWWVKMNIKSLALEQGRGLTSLGKTFKSEHLSSAGWLDQTSLSSCLSTLIILPSLHSHRRQP